MAGARPAAAAQRVGKLLQARSAHASQMPRQQHLPRQHLLPWRLGSGPRRPRPPPQQLSRRGSRRVVDTAYRHACEPSKSTCVLHSALRFPATPSQHHIDHPFLWCMPQLLAPHAVSTAPVSTRTLRSRSCRHAPSEMRAASRSPTAHKKTISPGFLKSYPSTSCACWARWRRHACT